MSHRQNFLSPGLKIESGSMDDSVDSLTFTWCVCFTKVALHSVSFLVSQFLKN